MSCTAHVVKEYVKKFAKNSWFNWKGDEVEDLLNSYLDLNVTIEVDDPEQQVITYSTEQDCGPGKHWEINADGLKQVITVLDTLPTDEKNIYVSDYTNGELRRIFREWLKYADDEGTIRVEWF